MRNGGSITGATDNVVLPAGEVTDAATAYQDDGVFLQIMTFAADIRCNFLAVGKAHAGNLSHRPAVDKVIAVNFDSPAIAPPFVSPG